MREKNLGEHGADRTKDAKVPQTTLLEEIREIPAWTQSKVEEFLGGIWFIAGFCAWNGGLHWAAWLLWGKATLDTMCALLYALLEKGEADRSRKARKAASVEPQDPKSDSASG